MSVNGRPVETWVLYAMPRLTGDNACGTGTACWA